LADSEVLAAPLLALPQGREIAGNVHDLGAEARKLGLPVLLLIGFA
jgi:hypothetical protein